MFFSLPQFPASSVGGAATAPAAAGSCDYVIGSTAHKLAKDCKRIIMPSIRDRIPTRLRLQRRSEKRAAHQHATHHHLLDPATAQPVATSEDYENLRTRLALRKDASDRRWMSMERVAMQGGCEDGQDCREAGEMLAMGRGPWRFAQRSSVRVGEEREEDANWGADVEGWEIVDVREARIEMPSEVEVAGRRPWADMKKKVVGRGGKKSRAVWV